MAGPARLVVRLTPRSGADRLDGWTTDEAGRPVLKARTRAPPIEGRANAALERLLAEALGLPPRAVRLTAGGSGRLKTVVVDGLDDAEARHRLGGPPP